jgi:hypothetical protein
MVSKWSALEGAIVPDPVTWGLRAAVIVVALAGWFWTQSLIGRRAAPEGTIGDGLHVLFGPLHGWLWARPRWANLLLIATSALIDSIGLFLLISTVFGPSVRPFLGLLMLFVLRQICQGVCSLPPPEGMIWRDPGFPSLLVTYGTSTDLFFSGHTAIAVYGALELGRVGGPLLGGVGAAIALIEAATVLILRAHYTMDVYAGLFTALWVFSVAGLLSPACDAAIAALRLG